MPHLAEKALDNRWEFLINHLGGYEYANKMKSIGTIEGGDGLWYNNNSDYLGTNESGFNALPSGRRFFEGYSTDMGYSALFWSTNGDGSSNNYSAYNLKLGWSTNEIYLATWLSQDGFSIRCIQD